MNRMLLLALLLSVGPWVQARENINSELAHVIGGAVIAAGATAWIAENRPELDRRRSGFAFSAGLGVLSQGIEYLDNTNSFNAAFLDAASHTLGAALGAYLTDRYLLTPVVQLSNNLYGVTLAYRF